MNYENKIDTLLDLCINISNKATDKTTSLLIELLIDNLQRQKEPEVDEQKPEVDEQKHTFDHMLSFMIKEDIEAKDNNGSTFLINESKDNHIDSVKFLIKNGANIEAKDNDGTTALMWASLNGNLEIVKYLLEKGADIDAKTNFGTTSLMLFLFNRSNFLDSRTNIEANKYNFFYYLLDSRANIEANKYNCFYYLLESGAKIEAKDNKDNTVLMWASILGHLEIVRYLLEKGANIEAKDNDGNTSLLLASHNGHLEIVKYLLDNDADIEAKDNDGKTALMRASQEVHPEIVEYLVEKGANIEVKEIYETVLALLLVDKSNYRIVIFLTKLKDKIGKLFPSLHPYITNEKLAQEKNREKSRFGLFGDFTYGKKIQSLQKYKKFENAYGNKCFASVYAYLQEYDKMALDR